MIRTDRTRLSKLLVQAALSNRSQSSRAVYHATLALASYHRDSNILEVHQMKHAALQDLHLHDHPSMYDAIELIAANLLLCVLEVRTKHEEEYIMLTPKDAASFRKNLMLDRLPLWCKTSDQCIQRIGSGSIQ